MEKKKKIRAVRKYFAVNIVAVDAKGRSLRFDTHRAAPKYMDESGIGFSPEGINIMCSKPLPPESKIQMKMMIPDREGLNLIKTNGTIKWFKQVKGKYKKYFVIGVHFRDLEEEAKKKLVDLWKRYYQD